MFSAAKKAMEKAKAKEEELREKHADKLEAAREKVAGAREKMGSGLEAAREMTDAGLETAREKVDERRGTSEEEPGPGMAEKLTAGLDSAREAAAAAKQRTVAAAAETVSKVRMNMTPPRTEKEKGLLSDHIFVICNSCEARLGPIKESKFNGMFNKVKTGASAGGMLTGNPLLMIGGAKAGKEALMSKIAPGSGDGSRKDIKDKAGAYLSQCNKCGQWNCPDCFDQDSGFCPRCG